MKGLVLATLAVLIACTIGVPSVVRFDVDREYQKTVRLQAFNFTNCLPAAREIAVVNSLILLPDPLHFPGPLSVSFDITFHAEVSDPLKAVVLFEKKVGSTWIKIPCIGNIGSCTYKDICELLQNIPQCPDSFMAAGVPCKCPFETGEYKLTRAEFEVLAAVLPSGEYHVQANLTTGSATVGCYDIHAAFD